jgi:hypothetical protein
MIHILAQSCLGKAISITDEHWNRLITNKHPVMAGQEEEVRAVLENADEIRVSKVDNSVFLYYKGSNGRFLCVVAKHLNDEGFIITAYPTDKIKEGKLVWKR